MFRGYFWLLMVISPLALLAYAVAGNTRPALGMALIVALAVVAHPWVMRHLNTVLEARDFGDISGVTRLHRLDVGGTQANSTLLATVIADIPYAVQILTRNPTYVTASRYLVILTGLLPSMIAYWASTVMSRSSPLLICPRHKTSMGDSVPSSLMPGFGSSSGERMIVAPSNAGL